MTEQSAYYGMVDRHQDDAPTYGKAPRVTRWHERLMGLAAYVSGWSKDPSTRVGAVLANPYTNAVIGLGYNGLPRGIEDDHRLNDRNERLSIVVHAEVNAILNANGTAYGATLYTTHQPCSQCAAAIINAGIKKVVYIENEDFAKRWGYGGVSLLTEAGIEVMAVR